MSDEESTSQPGASERNPQSTADALLPMHTPAQAAQILSVRESWLRRRAGERRIPCTFLGRHLRFSPADITAIAADGARPARATTARDGHRFRPTGTRHATTGPDSPVRRARRRPGMERS